MREIQIWILKQSLSYEDTLVHIVIKSPKQIMKLGLQKLSYRALCHSKAEHGKLRATDIIQHIKLELLLFEDNFSYCFNIYMFFICMTWEILLNCIDLCIEHFPLNLQ